MTFCLAFIIAIYFLVCAVTITASAEQYANLSDMICVETAPVIVTYIVEKEAQVLPTESSIKSLLETYGNVTNVKLMNFPSDEKTNFQSGSAAVHFSLTTDGIRSALKSVEEFQQKTVDGVTYFCRLHDSLQEMIYSIHTNNFAQQDTKLNEEDERNENERPKADSSRQHNPFFHSLGGALVSNGVLYATFTVLGLTPLGPLAGGWFAANMGAGLAKGSLMAILQSAAMRPMLSYVRATAVGSAMGLLRQIQDCVAERFTSRIPEIKEYFQRHSEYAKETVAAGISASIPVIQEHYEYAKETLATGVSSSIPVIQEHYEYAKETLATGVSSSIPVIQEHYEYAKDTLATGVSSSIPVIQEHYEYAKETLATGVSSSIPVIQEQFENVKDTLATGVSASIPVIQEQYENVKDRIKDFFSIKTR